MKKVLYILGQLTDRDVEWLVAAGQKRRLAPGTVLIREGEPTDAVYFVLGGDLAVTQGAGEGRPIGRLGVGEIVGEMSFVDASPPSATVRAVEDSAVLRIPRDLLRERLKSDDGFAARFYHAIAIFLSDRLRSALVASGGPGARPGGGLESGELDPSVLDTMSLAGGRFQQMLIRLGGT